MNTFAPNTHMPHSAPEVQSLDSRIREGIRTKIINGKLQGGAHLSELKISKDFKVSRTPVREALCALAADGLVEMIPHRGAFVLNVPAATRADQLHTFGQFVALAAGSAANQGSMEARMALEVDLQAIQQAATPEILQAALESFAKNTLLASQSETLINAAEMITRKAPVVGLYTEKFDEKDTAFKHANQAFQAIKQSDAAHAEKAMRQFFATLENQADKASTSTQSATMPGAQALQSALKDKMATHTDNPFATTVRT